MTLLMVDQSSTLSQCHGFHDQLLGLVVTCAAALKSKSSEKLSLRAIAAHRQPVAFQHWLPIFR